MNSTELRTILAAANVTVLTSSRGTETSREGAAWGQGALLQAFSDPEADINHDHLLNANGLGNYVARHVPMLNDQQHPDMEVRFNETLFAGSY